LAWAVLFNTAPAQNFNYAGAIETALSQIPSFPSEDQLGNFTSALATPVLDTNPVVSAATFLPGIVAGSWVSIFGSNLATASRAWRSDEFLGDDFSLLPLAVDSVTVTIDGKPAPVSYVSRTQINMQAPTDTATGPVTVIVTHDGQSAAPVQATLESTAPGFFGYSSGNNLFPAAVHLNGSLVGDPSTIPGAAPAVPGETIEIFGTGFAPSPSGTENIVVSPLSPAPVVTIGGMQTTVTFAGLSGPGLYQLSVVVPNLAPRTYAVQVSWDGVTSGSAPQLLIGSN